MNDMELAFGWLDHMKSSANEAELDIIEYIENHLFRLEDLDS